MIQYITAREAAEKWNISQRRVSVLCAENRIPGVAMLGNMWIIPRDAEKPQDERKKKTGIVFEHVHPFIKWAGGKGQLLDTLKKHLPEGIGETVTKYAEPFVGGGALLFSLLSDYTFDEIYVNDRNSELMNAYEVIRDDCGSLTELLRTLQTQYDMCKDMGERQVCYYEQRTLFNELKLSPETRIKKAALFIFLNKTCFNGLYRVNRAGLFNVPFGKHQHPTICDAENLEKISSLLQNAILRAVDYHDVLHFADEKTFVYIDPPYRPLNKTATFTSYTEDGFTDEDQIQLAAM